MSGFDEASNKLLCCVVHHAHTPSVLHQRPVHRKCLVSYMAHHAAGTSKHQWLLLGVWSWSEILKPKPLAIVDGTGNVDKLEQIVLGLSLSHGLLMIEALLFQRVLA